MRQKLVTYSIRECVSSQIRFNSQEAIILSYKVDNRSYIVVHRDHKVCFAWYKKKMFYNQIILSACLVIMAGVQDPTSVAIAFTSRRS